MYDHVLSDKELLIGLRNRTREQQLADELNLPRLEAAAQQAKLDYDKIKNDRKQGEKAKHGKMELYQLDTAVAEKRESIRLRRDHIKEIDAKLKVMGVEIPE